MACGWHVATAAIRSIMNREWNACGSRTYLSATLIPTSVDKSLIDSISYSISNNRPSGENVLSPKSHSKQITNILNGDNLNFSKLGGNGNWRKSRKLQTMYKPLKKGILNVKTACGSSRNCTSVSLTKFKIMCHDCTVLDTSQ